MLRARAIAEKLTEGDEFGGGSGLVGGEEDDPIPVNLYGKSKIN